MRNKREITRDDILPMEAYARERKDRRGALLEIKKRRRMGIGPVCTFYFENYETMWAQVHEMLFIEQGGDEQLADELAAYNPLIPKGGELVATAMFEIDDEARRRAFLAKLGGIEQTAYIEFDGETITGVPEHDVDRTTADGKASSVQFVHFPFTPDQVAKFKRTGTSVTLGFRHPSYSHMAIMPESVRAALAEDFD